MLFSSSTSFIPWHSLEEVRAEFAEFQESSGELEGELEAQLDQVEKSNKDLMHRVSRLDDENESLKSKLDSQQAEAFVTISTLQEERVELLALKDALQKYIRQLEQNNDDLERGKRSVWFSFSPPPLFHS
jgi:nuclear distribution protein NudE